MHIHTRAESITVRVYSDELYVKDADSWKARTVQLSRVEATPGIVTGWRLLVAAEGSAGSCVCCWAGVIVPPPILYSHVHASTPRARPVPHAPDLLE